MDTRICLLRLHLNHEQRFVERKNWTVVRQAVGYARYDTAEELQVLRELFGRLRLWVNFFQPQARREDTGGRQGQAALRHADDPLPSACSPLP